MSFASTRHAAFLIRCIHQLVRAYFTLRCWYFFCCGIAGAVAAASFIWISFYWLPSVSHSNSCSISLMIWRCRCGRAVVHLQHRSNARIAHCLSQHFAYKMICVRLCASEVRTAYARFVQINGKSCWMLTEIATADKTHWKSIRFNLRHKVSDENYNICMMHFDYEIPRRLHVNWILFIWSCESETECHLTKGLGHSFAHAKGTICLIQADIRAHISD